ncbi:MAG: rhomboid family intramembrane serine protease [Candidatus Cardinium sp.]|uniref:rhomboid family intramembrane serine protease n=1 Tax=Candidatus Cardinium sp. TP TaxID=2961955 RepID=UPI0021AFFC75|nr:rhomboid family intramembrane serine protease [Candidatus Cardinium sp. TP]MDN5247142.1 rhomboid family intramembrane serine protease [Candidatus Cardinium sp.]
MHVVYAYLRNQFKQSESGFMQLIWVHVLCFLLLFLFNTGCYICGYEERIPWFHTQLTFPSLYPFLLERPWAIVTYSFVHKGLVDLFWDICLLYIFGQRIRATVRSKHILRLYSLGQIMGAIVFFILYQFSPPFKGMVAHLTGPSAAIYAIMVAVCVLMPSLRLYCFFFSLPLKYIVIVLLIIALMHLPTQDAGYYLAQLGGGLVGYIYARLCKNDLDLNPSFFSLHRGCKPKMSVRVTKQ